MCSAHVLADAAPEMCMFAKLRAAEAEEKINGADKRTDQTALTVRPVQTPPKTSRTANVRKPARGTGCRVLTQQAQTNLR